MIIMKQILRFGLFLVLLLQGISINAQSNYTLGGGSGQLDIRMNSNGSFEVLRGGTRQIFQYTPAFALKFSGSAMSYQGGSSINDSHSNLTVLSAVDGGITNSGTLQYRTKVYSGTHSGSSFSVTVTYIYDTSNPDYFVMQMTTDMRQISGGNTVSLGVGMDSFVNGCDEVRQLLFLMLPAGMEWMLAGI